MFPFFVAMPNWHYYTYIILHALRTVYNFSHTDSYNFTFNIFPYVSIIILNLFSVFVYIALLPVLKIFGSPASLECGFWFVVLNITYDFGKM